MDIANIDSVDRVLSQLNPWAVINTAGYVKVDQAEFENDLCFRENCEGPSVLARYCADFNLPFLTFSSDLVFDGELDEAYLESHEVHPLNVYGRSKAESENLVLGVHPGALVVRTSSFFGPWDQYNFATRTLQDLAHRRPVTAAYDMKVSPTYVPDLVHTCLDLIIDGEFGLLHLVNGGGVSWAEFARIILDNAGQHRMRFDPSLIIERSISEMNLQARRPRNAVLGSERVRMMPPLEEAVSRYLSETEFRV
jgi:dTDP-4-dehydrorhamnose reductase